MKIYISGRITGNPDYREQFSKAEEYLKGMKHDVFNPTCIPDIFTWDEFMLIDLAALSCCDAIYMLEGWKESKGAREELEKARKLRLPVFFEGTPNLAMHSGRVV